MSYFDPTTWRAFVPEETISFLKSRKEKDEIKNPRKRRRVQKDILVLQKSVSPFDVYTYLHARFGPPNGFQTFLAGDHSDNLFHWDYFLKAGHNDLIFTGATKEVQVKFEGDLSDADFLNFIARLKADFGRVGQAKSEFIATLEEWSVFPNQYLSVANRCAELYDDIETSLPEVNRLILVDDLSIEFKSLRKAKVVHSFLAKITAAPTELSLLMPVMFESFIGLLIAGLIKPEIKQNPRIFDAFIRAPLDIKIMDLSVRCNGFSKAIEQNNPAFSRYWTVVNKRNNVIHGNIDPVKNSLETVYFDGKRPLYKTGGNRIQEHWAGLLKQYKPQEVLDDYIAMHEFIFEILAHLEPRLRRSLLLVMQESQPGWDNKRKIFGCLLPENIVMTTFPGQRHDWQLQAEH